MTLKQVVSDKALAEVVENLYRSFRELPGFRGADAGFMRRGGCATEEICLRVHIERKLPEAALAPGRSLPSEFDGLALDVIEANYSAEASEIQSDTGSYVTGGTQCFGPGGSGQVAMLVLDQRSRRVGFLSSWVAVAGSRGYIGAEIYSRQHNAAETQEIGTLQRTTLDHRGSASLVELRHDQPWLPIEWPCNRGIEGVGQAEIGQDLRAGLNRVRVEGIGIYRVQHEISPGVVRNVDIEGFRISASAPIGSGALIREHIDGLGVGICSAVETSGSDEAMMIASNLAGVMEALEVRIATFEDLLRAPAGARPHPLRPVHDVLGDPRESLPPAPAYSSETAIGSDNTRLDIATVIWPRLRVVLEFANLTRPRGITDRVERLDPTGRAHALVADAINRVSCFSDLGLDHVGVEQISGTTTLDQICERINDLLEEVEFSHL